ncbi:hypothetical protein [Acinetobacter guillouiae]|uniref:hypothetical protein n=1 Tax=Acinetobacter guillouiae TaxID=106649 RepID=UPI00300AB7E0
MLNFYDRFKWSIMALAQKPEIQVSLFPHGSYIGEEIILEYDEAVGANLEKINSNGLSSTQLHAIKQLDQYILDHCGNDFEDLWLNNENLTSKEWEIIRILAKNIIEVMNWELEVPKELYDHVIYTNK